MIKSYLKIAWRNTWYHKGYSAINIFGLGLGMAVALLIGLWAVYQFQYDRFFPGYREAAQVMIHIKQLDLDRTQPSVSLPVKEALTGMPGIRYVAESGWLEYRSLIAENKKLYLGGIGAGADYLRILDYPLLDGDPATCLREPYSIVLTAATARSLFGQENPMGKLVKIDNDNSVKVTGILKDIPSTATVSFAYLLPFAFLEKTRNWIANSRNQWGNNSFQMWVRLAPHTDLASLNHRIAGLYKRSQDVNMQHFITFLYPASRWHLYTEYQEDQNGSGLIAYVRMFCLIGAMVLLIACINFVNLATARSDRRAREVGVRKVVGSSRSEIIVQFLLESYLLTCIAFVFALLLAIIALPYFNRLTACDIRIPFSDLRFWLVMGGYLLLTGLLAGARPAFYLSSFLPVRVLKGTLQASHTMVLPRKALVVLQFVCSVTLVIAASVIYQQIRYAQLRPKGYNTNRLVSTAMSEDLNRNYAALRNDIMQSGVVESVSLTSSGATWVDSHTMLDGWEGKQTPNQLGTGIMEIDKNYFATTGMQMLEGRNFFQENAQADSSVIIVNEAAVRAMHLKDPVGKLVKYYEGGAHGPELKQVAIIGVVKDAIMESPYTPVSPAIYVHGRRGNYLLYRLSNKVAPVAAIGKLTAIFERYNPAYPYEYNFVDADYAAKFALEKLVGTLAAIFAGLTILISCLGLFALATYMAAQRTREIGIRKVLGATIWQLWMLLSKDFVWLVGISCLLAAPVAWMFLQHWLEQYNYRIHLGAGIFLAASAVALFITVCTISYQAIRAAMANPVKSLRTE
ncbi:ABC-type antimicrobial peptide transport system, permease component [Chitinophaga costaii]|uniref:ABC-type antimicrobial peptide transport system, permease component n=1 Tax=Chitinophaga costaii TaxID=1335309 RepID=A0A1C4F7X8_9BACT|nr:ABC transporter permease [Chitinophaga costaii]PUZ21195.1 ABC transporter permease [Chitinophaga costaii]SCC52118.1 ABC-type antimicrobial peptide transport system, permease component [Chitinophaga costaii]